MTRYINTNTVFTTALTTSLLKFTFALCSTSNCAVASCPLNAAVISGVHPSCKSVNKRLS